MIYVNVTLEIIVLVHNKACPVIASPKVYSVILCWEVNTKAFMLVGPKGLNSRYLMLRTWIVTTSQKTYYFDKIECRSVDNNQWVDLFWQVRNEESDVIKIGRVCSLQHTEIPWRFFTRSDVSRATKGVTNTMIWKATTVSKVFVATMWSR
jgi:hypothetical protein